jgi:hypothetical protein
LDDNFQTYINRVARLTLPETHRGQLQHIQSSPKFRLVGETPQAQPFPGYSIITPPRRDDAENSAFYDQLRDWQAQVVAALPRNLLVPVPPSSFHITLADLIWNRAYWAAAERPGFEEKLRDRIAHIFTDYRQRTTPSHSIYWQVLGLAVRTRGITISLAPKDEATYEPIVALRRTIYQNPDLIAHVTLGYFAALPDPLDIDAISETLNHINLEWLSHDDLHSVWLHRAELRKFEDMTFYFREPDWPAIEL